MTAPSVAKPMGVFVLMKPEAWLAQFMMMCAVYTETVRVLSSQTAPNFHVRHRLSSHNAVICVHDDAGNVIEAHEHKRDFIEP